LIKNLLHILLITAFFGKSLFFIGWEIVYKIDQKRIAKELCENKFKPALKCNGKCYLAKKLKKLQEEAVKKNSEKKSNPYSVKSLDEKYCTITKTFLFSEMESPIKHEFSYISFYSLSHSKIEEKPPSVAA
jgi:hypothetical protein